MTAAEVSTLNQVLIEPQPSGVSVSGANRNQPGQEERRVWGLEGSPQHGEGTVGPGTGGFPTDFKGEQKD